jgi:hypothetical protein
MLHTHWKIPEFLNNMRRPMAYQDPKELEAAAIMALSVAIMVSLTASVCF